MAEANLSAQSNQRKCSFSGCEKKYHARGYCTGHLSQINDGRPLMPLKRYKPCGGPPIIEFEEVECTYKSLPGKCRIFLGLKNSAGYGTVYMNGKNVLVHRYVHEQSKGTIEEGLVIDHQCRNRACINVDHLRVVTQAVNAVENVEGSVWQIQLAKTHCSKGHPYDEENTILRKGKRSGHRECLACRRQRNRDKRRKVKEAKLLQSISMKESNDKSAYS